MNKTRKMIILILLIIIFFFVFQSINLLSQSTESMSLETYDYKFVLIKESNEEFYWDRMEELLKKYGREKKIFIEVLEAENTGFNFQKEMFEMATLIEPDGIITKGFSEKTKNEMAIEAKKEGIPIVFIREEGNNVSRTTYIGQNNYKVGQQSILELMKRDAGELNLLIVDDSTKDIYKNTTLDGMLSVISKSERVELIESIKVENQYILDNQLKQILLEKEAINTIILPKAHYGIVAAETIIRLNKVGDIEVIAFDPLNKTLEYIKSGVITFSLYNDHEGIAKKAIEVLVQANEDKFVGDVYYTPTNIISIENVEEYMDEVSNANE